MNAKPIWKSKTFWLNIVAGILFVLQTAGVIEPTHMVGVELPVEMQALLLAIVNLGLRAVTKKPVTLK